MRQLINKSKCVSQTSVLLQILISILLNLKDIKKFLFLSLLNCLQNIIYTFNNTQGV